MDNAKYHKEMDEEIWIYYFNTDKIPPLQSYIPSGINTGRCIYSQLIAEYWGLA